MGFEHDVSPLQTSSCWPLSSAGVQDRGLHVWPTFSQTLRPSQHCQASAAGNQLVSAVWVYRLSPTSCRPTLKYFQGCNQAFNSSFMARTAPDVPMVGIATAISGVFKFFSTWSVIIPSILLHVQQAPVSWTTMLSFLWLPSWWPSSMATPVRKVLTLGPKEATKKNGDMSEADSACLTFISKHCFLCWLSEQ